MSKRGKIVLLHFVGQMPLAGIAWQAVNYLVGLEKLGYETWYVEDHGANPYDPRISSVVMDCVEVCPVDCFYEGENMLVIHPDECIDCGVCEPECPVEAIIPDSEPVAEQWLEVNRQYAASWPNITRKKPYPEDADQWKDVEGKYEKFFSPNPGGR